MTERSYDIQFVSLVLSLQGTAMHQMGKTAHPMTGQIDRQIERASETIQMLEMIERKTKGNLDADEQKLLGHVLYELRMNYVDEVKKGPTATAPDSSEPVS